MAWTADHQVDLLTCSAAADVSALLVHVCIEKPMRMLFDGQVGLMGMRPRVSNVCQAAPCQARVASNR